MSAARDSDGESRPGVIQNGPYRATQLWNEILKTFENGMATGKHRRQLKTYDDCFVASEAVTWLHDHLESNPNFGPFVTRAQTVQLLEKFHKARLFEDVRGVKLDKEVFVDNGRLYRFVLKCDGTKSLPRQPLASRSTNVGEKSSTMPGKGPVKVVADKPPKPPRQTEVPAQPPREPECHLVARPGQLTKGEIEAVWKDLTLTSLQKLLQLKMVEEVVDPDSVNVGNLIHNMTYINKNGIVSNIEKKDQLPHWVISAMRCLAYWPEEVDKDFPSFKGFEKDVFKVVKDYFDMLPEPLVTFPMYDLFINCMAENLILNMTQNSHVQSDDVIVVHDPEVPNRSRSGFSRQGSVSSMPGTRIETSFGVEGGREPHSQLYQSEDHGYYNVLDNTQLPYQPASRRNESFMVSMDNVCARTRDVMAPEPPTSRFYSMNNVNDVQQFPENGFRERSNTCDSWASSVNSVRPKSSFGVRDSRGDFGYTVVLSSAPRVEIESRVPLSHYRSHGNLPMGGTYAESSDTGFGSKRGSVVSDISDSASTRPDDPPPYVPPPSYNTLFTGRPIQRSDTWSACSFETARSQNSSAASHQSPPSMYRSAEGLPMEAPEYYPSTRSISPLPRQRSGVNLAESYRAAIDNSLCNTTPVGRSLFAPLKRASSSPSILSPMSRNRVQEVLQLCCLMLPPANRRKLHLLLRFMNKVTNNEQLTIEKGSSNRQVMLRIFTRLILRPEDEADFDEIFTLHVVSFLIDNYQDIMKVPEGLRFRIEDKISLLKRQKVSVEQFERQKLSSSQRALSDLLESIIHDKRMSTKDKKKRLKQFQKSYPDIYSKRFPTTESEAGLFPNKPKIKPPLLSRPLQKLKSFRI